MVKIFFIFLIAAIGLCSCDSPDAHLIVTEADKATKEFNEKYFDITCGEWYNEKSDSLMKFMNTLSLEKTERTYI